FQKYMIFPGAMTQGRDEAVVEPFDGGELLRLGTPAGEKVAALFGAAMTPADRPHPDAARRPTLVYFYGNGMCMADCKDDWADLRRRGYNVILPEFLGYGMSEGKP